MMDLLNIVYQKEQGTRNGSLHGILAIVIFLVLFKPIVWILKVTGIFSLLQWMRLIDAHGYFDFVALFVYFMGFIALILVWRAVYIIYDSISDYLIGLGNK